MSGATGLRFNFSSSSRPSYSPHGEASEPHGAPFFERINTAEELQQCKRLIDTLQTRVMDLERINVDLEYRLEDQAKQCMNTEKECISLERKWRAECSTLEKDIETWKNGYEAEKQRSAKLREHLSRTERELYSILQRKYELMRTGNNNNNNSSSSVNRGAPSSSSSGSSSNSTTSSSSSSSSAHQLLMRGSSNANNNANNNANSKPSTMNNQRRIPFESDNLHHSSNSNNNSSNNNNNYSFPNSLKGSDLRRSSHTHSHSQYPSADDFGMHGSLSQLSLHASTRGAPQEIRQRRMMASLTDFLGL